MKKTLYLIPIVAFFCLFLFSVTGRAEGATLQGEIVETSAEQVEYSVSISGNPGISSIMVTIYYDRNALSAVNTGTAENPAYAAMGDFTNQGGLQSAVSYKTAYPNREYLTVMWLNASGDVSTDGTLFTVRFAVNKAASSGSYPITVSYRAADTVNYEGTRVAFVCNNGEVTIRRFEPTFVGELAEGAIGTDVTYSVSVRDNPGMYGFKISLLYDSTVLKLKTVTGTDSITRPDVTLGTSYSNPFFSSSGLISGGFFVLWSNSSIISEDGVLFTVTFTITGAASATDYPVVIQYDAENTIGENEEELTFTSEDGAVRVLPSTKFIGVNLNITDDLKIQFFAFTSDPDNTLFRLTHNGNVIEVTEKTYVSPERGYRFVYRLGPQQMADAIDISLVYNGAIVATRANYSVATYANDLYSRYSSVPVLMNLLADMLEYGAAAQNFTSQNLDNLANDYAWVATYRTAFTDVTTDSVKIGTGDSGATLVGSSLDLTDVVNIYYVVDATDVTNLSASLYRIVSGVESLVRTVDISSGRNYIRTDDLFAYEYDSLYRLSLTRDGVEIASNQFSVKSYVAAMQNNTSYPKLADLVRALWRYGESARAYPRS